MPFIRSQHRLKPGERQASRCFQRVWYLDFCFLCVKPGDSVKPVSDAVHHRQRFYARRIVKRSRMPFRSPVVGGAVDRSVAINSKCGGPARSTARYGRSVAGTDLAPGSRRSGSQHDGGNTRAGCRHPVRPSSIVSEGRSACPRWNTRPAGVWRWQRNSFVRMLPLRRLRNAPAMARQAPSA